MKTKLFLKKTFLAGLIALIPIAGTLWLLKIIIFTAEGMAQALIPSRFRPINMIGYNIPGMGIVAALIVVFLVGLFTRLYIGRRVLAYGDKLFSSIPFGRGIYSAIKQFLGTITGDQQKSFRQVVLVEYPSPDIFAIGFLTGYTRGEIQAKTPSRVMNIFIPTTPNPTSGFLLLFPEEKVTFLDMPVEDAFKFIVSGGVVAKPLLTKQSTPAGDEGRINADPR